MNVLRAEFAKEELLISITTVSGFLIAEFVYDQPNWLMITAIPHRQS